MGNLCDCLNDKSNEKTRLLAGNHNTIGNNQGVTTEPQRQQPRSNNASPTQAPGRSARMYPSEEREFESSLDALCPITLDPIPSLPALNKTFQDHAKLYNDMYANFVELKKCVHDFKANFVAETSGIPVLSQCLQLLAQRCGVSLNGSRTKNCIQIIYDAKIISKSCKGPAEDVLEMLELYNKANKLIRSILDKSSLVENSIRLVLEEGEKLKREVLKADTDGKQGPEPLRRTSANLNKMRELPVRISTIHKYTTKTFREISEGSKVLFMQQQIPWSSPDV